jgi:ABC-type microcin C transport system duplicated ATPase subunit YejF
MRAKRWAWWANPARANRSLGYALLRLINSDGPHCVSGRRIRHAKHEATYAFRPRTPCSWYFRIPTQQPQPTHDGGEIIAEGLKG